MEEKMEEMKEFREQRKEWRKERGVKEELGGDEGENRKSGEGGMEGR